MKKVISFLFAILIVCLSVLPAYAVYYEDSFPSAETGLTGGLFIECNTNLGDCVIVIPYNFKENTFTFSTSGNVFNASSTSISGALYLDGSQYTVRWAGYSFPQYRLSDTGYTYTDLIINSVSDTNIVFVTDDAERSNDNYYLSVYEKIIISLLFTIFFFVFLSWFLLHKNRGVIK